MNPQGFHFLRPECLLALALLVPAFALAWRRRSGSGWERICEPHLLRHLLAAGGATHLRLALAVFAVGWAAACVALAGPTWERLPQPAFADPSRTVFVLGLAPSMQSRDVAPSRIARARHKILDALDRLSSGSAALVVYREEAFAATPLTDDLQVLRELVPLLETNLAPGRRVLPARGIEEAVRLLEPLGLTGTDILLVTDGTDDDPEATRAAAADAARRGARVSALGVTGTSAQLEEVVRAGHGSLAALTADDRDLAQVVGDRDLPIGVSLAKSEHRADTWRDMGAWLVWVPLLLAPLAFRKGWATALLALAFLPLPAGPAQAGVRDWFERPDQRGARAFAEEQYDASAKTFEDPAWRAAALYRAGDFDGAAAALANRSDPDSAYNRGNALARKGRLEEALSSYETALAAKPDDPDALFNRDLVKKLLEEQKPPPSDPTSKSGDRGDGDAKSSSQGESGDGASDDSSASDSGSQDGKSPDDGDASKGDAAGPEGPPDEEASPPAGSAAAEADADTPKSENASGETGAGDEGPAETEAQPSTGNLAGSSDEIDGSANAASSPAGASTAPVSPEEQRAARWMARLPDDPGGLLREKIRRDYVRKTLARQQGDRP